MTKLQRKFLDNEHIDKYKVLKTGKLNKMHNTCEMSLIQ